MQTQSCFICFDDYEVFWHSITAPKQKPDSMYWDGQFDEIPYYEWENMPL